MQSISGGILLIPGFIDISTISHYHMGNFPQLQIFFAAAQENKDLRSPCRGPSSLLTNIFCVDPLNIGLGTSGFEQIHT